VTNQKTQSMSYLNKIQALSLKDDSKPIFKQVCRKCGGKGFYQSIVVIGNKQMKNEIVSCLDCEGGFVYGHK